MECLVVLLLREGKTDGPAICDKDGFVLSSEIINEQFRTYLKMVQDDHPDLIPPHLDVDEVYNIRRSPRRGSVSTAREAGVKEPTIDLINRWSGYENRGGRRAGKMRDHYTEIRMMKKGILVYSFAL